MFSTHFKNLLMVYVLTLPLVNFCYGLGDSNTELSGVTELTSPTFNNLLIQGALVSGNTQPGVKIRLDNTNVRVDEKGHFVFGLGRDYPNTLKLTLENKGKEKTFVYSVIQREYVTQSINGVENKYVSPPESVLKRISNEVRMVKKARNIYRPAKDYLATPILPAQGKITGVYGSQRIFNGVPKRPHFGLDIAEKTGTDVVAPLSGVVTFVNNDMYYSGGTLIVDHGDGVSSTFIHLHKIFVSQGDAVKQGEKIAEIGATGRVTGPHLDWRLNWFQERLDPDLLFKNQPVLRN